MLLRIYSPDSPACGTAFTEIEVCPGEVLSRAIWLSGAIAPIPLCGGSGLCGRCAVRFKKEPPAPCSEESRFFSDQQLDLGWRLACRHTLKQTQGILELELQTGVHTASKDRLTCISRPIVPDAVVGIDLGTTSIQWQAFSPTAPQTPIASGETLNPQAPAGPDVISRLQFASQCHGLPVLSRLIQEKIFAFVDQLSCAGHTVRRICIAANSAMTEILLQKNITGLCHAPYELSFTGNRTEELAFRDRKIQVFIPPLPAPFVGGDISAGLAALLERNIPRPFVLADFGTNAELALLDETGNLYLTSAPLGPAMEGIGPRCGQIAGPGVITQFTLEPGGLGCIFGAGATGSCLGISATGYLSLLAILLRLGIIRPDGQFVTPRNIPSPLGQKIASALSDDGSMPLPLNQFLSLPDIEQLLKVKATFAVALQRLLEVAGKAPSEIGALCLAGALGQYFSVQDLETLGFLPSSMARKTIGVGNTALAGAVLLALEPQKSVPLAKLCERAVIIQLADDINFLTAYLEAMRWG